MQYAYLPHADAERRSMLDLLGLASQEDLLSVIPSVIRANHLPELPPAQSEIELAETFRQCRDLISICKTIVHIWGRGFYHHHIPAVVNHMAGRSEFYTAYTPINPR